MSTLRAFQALCKVAAAAGALSPMTQNFGTTEEQIKRVYGPNNPVVQTGAKDGYKPVPKKPVVKPAPKKPAPPVKQMPEVPFEYIQQREMFEKGGLLEPRTITR